MTFSAFLAATSSSCLGRLEPIRAPGGDHAADDDDGEETIGHRSATTAVVGDVISSLEQSSSSLNKGVLVAASDWTSDVPRGFLRALQSRHGQPVYAVAVARLLADGHRGDDDADEPQHQQQHPQTQQQDEPDDDRHNHFDQTAGWLPAACKRPESSGGRATVASTLPLRAGYAVVFADLGPLVALAAIDRGFWDADVYYLLVVREFGLAVRQTVHGLWRDRSVYK